MTKRHDLIDPADPAGLLPEQRLTGVAAILATGVVRMRQRQAVSVPKVRPYRNWVRGAGSPKRGAAAFVPKIRPESGENRLELSREASPDGQRG